jgi:hypothetical protein
MVAESAVNERIAEIIYILKKEGFSPKESAAILGNIDVETGGTFDYLQKQDAKRKGDGLGPGRGLFQFEGLKLNAYKEWLKENKKENSPESQIQYVKQSIQAPQTLPKSIMNLKGMEKAERVSDIVGGGNAKEIRKTFKEGNVAEAADVFGKLYERPNPNKNPKYDERKASAGTGGTASTAKQALNPNLNTYERQLALAAKQFGHSIRAVKDNPTQYPEVYAAVQAMRGSNIINPNKKFTYPQALEQSGFTAGDFSGIISGRADLAREMMNRGTFSILDNLGIIAPNIRSSSIGHTIPLQALRNQMAQSFSPFKFKRGIDKEGVKSLIINPNLMFPEPTFMNVAKRGIESFLYNPSNKLKNLPKVGEILDEAGMTTTVLDPRTLSMTTFGSGRPMDVKQLNEYLTRILKDAPFGTSTKTGKNLLFPTTQFLKRNFLRGGIASLLE